MLDAASASLRSSCSEAILPTRTRVRPLRVSMKSGSTPNWVTVGPRWISTTRAGAPKAARVSSISRARSCSRCVWAVAGVGGSRICSTVGICQLGSLADASVAGSAGGTGSRAGMRARAVREGFSGSGFRSPGSSWGESSSLSGISGGWAEERRAPSRASRFRRFRQPVRSLRARSGRERSKSRMSATSSQATSRMTAPALPVVPVKSHSKMPPR